MVKDKYKVVLVDDSALSRKIVGQALSVDPDISVEYSAPGAALAYKFLEKNKVDLVVLDVEMPEIDGIEAAGYISRKWPQIRILMCSSLTERGASVTLQALEKGASDYISKPTAKQGRESFSAEILAKVKSLLKGARRIKPTNAKTSAPTKVAYQTLTSPGFGGSLEALAIGCSTGGPPALDTFFAGVSRPFPVPTFIVQHMPPVFTRLLAERLAVKTGFLVKEGEHGEEVQNSVTYIAPGGKHMVVVERAGRRYIELNEDPMEHSCRPAVDVLFRSLAKVYRGKVIAAVFTGMGADGSGGVPVLEKSGAEILVQTPETCVVASMPTACLETGHVHKVLDLPDIAQRFEQRCAIAFRDTRKAQ